MIRVTLAVQSSDTDGSDASGVFGIALEAEPREEFPVRWVGTHIAIR